MSLLKFKIPETPCSIPALFTICQAFLTPTVMQAYVVLMFLAVVAGTIIDTIHKKSAQYFFENAQKAQKSARRTVSGGEKASLAISTLANEVLTSSEFANPKRRQSHLLTMYGFIFFVVTTVMMIFGYPIAGEAVPGLVVLCGTSAP